MYLMLNRLFLTLPPSIIPTFCHHLSNRKSVENLDRVLLHIYLSNIQKTKI